MNNSVHLSFARFFKEASLQPFLYYLSKKMQEGHICIDLDKINTNNEYWLEYGEKPEFPLIFPKDSELVGNESDFNKPFCLHNNRFYTGRNFYYESKVIERLKAIAEIDANLHNERMEALQNKLQFVQQLHNPSIKDDDGNCFPDWQFYAAISGFLNNFTIITGGPGTGKTTTVAKVLALLNAIQPGFKLALAAPTGKAAMRMKESLMNTVSDDRNKHLAIQSLVENVEPSTIHRLLGSKKDSVFFKHNAENPLNLDVIIIDESSMIGVGLFAKLLLAIKNGTRVIILGDSDQLASVEAGSLFGDICKGLVVNENKFTQARIDFFKTLITAENTLDETFIFTNKSSFLDEQIIRLKKTYRYEQASKLGQFTQAVIKGEEGKIQSILADENDSLIVDETYSESEFSSFVSGYEAYLNEKDIETALNKINQLRVLCAVRQGEQGVYAVNSKIETILRRKFDLKVTDGFYHNQPIMVTKNTPALNLFNGDVGIIRFDENKHLKAYFSAISNKEGGEETTRLIAINPALISDWETVFAMTIHKSQGSEFDAVMVVLPKQESNRLLTRELLYTAVTRAKKKAIIQSSLETISNTVRKGVDRVSGVQKRINTI